MPDIRRERKEAAESLTEKKKILKTKNIIFSFYVSLLGFCAVLFGCFCFTERSKSFFGNQCTTIDDWLIFLMHINAKTRV